MLRVESFPFDEHDNPLRIPVSTLLRDELYKGSINSKDIEEFSASISETEKLHTLALLLNGIVVATSSINIDTLKDPVTTISNLAVSSTQRRMGLGATILSASERFIIDNSDYRGTKLAKVSPIENEETIAFYTRMGYEFVSPNSRYMAKVIS